MANPADITNILNEVLAASNKLAATQLENSQNLTDIQEKASDKNKKLIKTIKNTVEQLSLFKEQVEEKKETKKKEKSVGDFLKSTLATIEKTAKPKTVKELVKVEKKKQEFEKVNITNSVLNVRGNLIVNSKNFKLPIDIGSKSSQSSEDFYRTDDAMNYMGEEIALLKSIESKLSFSGGSGSSLFDGLFSGIGNLAKLFTGASAAGVGGVAGSLFGLSKFKKLGSIFKPLSKLKPSNLLKDSGKVLKNPKMLIGLGLAAAGYTIYDSIKAGLFTKDFNEMGDAEQREKGGPVISGKPYIVGEKGPELFTPRETGKIIPNNKLLSHNEKYESSNDSMFDSLMGLIKYQNKMVKSNFDYFADSFEKVIDFFKPSHIIDMVKKAIGNIKDKVKDAATTAINFVGEKTTNIINTGSDIANKGLNLLGLTNYFQVPSLPVAPKEPAGPARRIGDKNVPRDMKVSLHKNEMVVPAIQSEALRAVAKLQNQNVSYPQTPQYVTKNQLGKEFWMNEFVPKFASMIKTEKESNNFLSYNVGNIFGVA